MNNQLALTALAVKDSVPTVSFLYYDLGELKSICQRYTLNKVKRYVIVYLCWLSPS